jgi:hypothetical protein
MSTTGRNVTLFPFQECRIGPRRPAEPEAYGAAAGEGSSLKICKFLKTIAYFGKTCVILSANLGTLPVLKLP